MLVSTRVWLVLDRHGWPVETVKGHTLRNVLRLLIHGRRLYRQTAVVELPNLGQRNRRPSQPRKWTWEPGAADPNARRFEAAP